MAGSKHGRGAEQVSLRLPDGLRDRIRNYADRQGRSMNAEIVRILEREFPEPVSLLSKLQELRRLNDVLRSAGDVESVTALSDEIRETLKALFHGAIQDIADENRDMILQSFSELQRDEAEEKYERFVGDLDEEEDNLFRATGETAKYPK